MSLFANPTENAANPPESWQVVKATERCWQLCAAGVALDRFKTRREAEAAKASGWLVNLWHKEARWYAGEPVPMWRPYVRDDIESGNVWPDRCPDCDLTVWRNAWTIDHAGRGWCACHD